MCQLLKIPCLLLFRLLSVLIGLLLAESFLIGELELEVLERVFVVLERGLLLSKEIAESLS